MKKDNLPDDDLFMVQFNQRLSLEPKPKWATARHIEFPWLEIGWALAGALLLGFYWTELRFGLDSLHFWLHQNLNQLPTHWLYVGLGLAYLMYSQISSTPMRDF